MSAAVTVGAVRVRHIPGAPVVAVRIALAGGARVEPAPSIALLTGRMLAEGSARRDYRALALAAETRGASFHSWGSYDSIGIGVDALATDWRLALDLGAEALFDSVFPDDRLELLRRQAGAELESLADQADLVTAREFSALLYGRHARGRPLQGSVASLARVDGRACREFHREAIARGGVVVVAGAIDEQEVGAVAEALFARLPAIGAPVPPRAEPPERAARRRELSTRARGQAHLFVGQLTVERHHSDFVALELAGVALGAGAGLTGRIPHRVREQEGLAYAASAESVGGASRDPGRLAAYVGTSPETVDRAERAVVEELRRFLAEGPTERELADARAYLLGREPFRRETARQWADLAAHAALLALPLDDEEVRREELGRPGRAEVGAALGRCLDVDRLAVTVGLPSG